MLDDASAAPENRSADAIADFSGRLIAWQQRHGRHHLPWQGQDAYGVWISEIMLQQTQVDTVVPYYRRFMARFPDVHALAAAHEDDVLGLWSGLGYYSRARNLHAAARDVVQIHGGVFPRDREALQALPGVGRSTAAAIAALAFAQREAILDGNVKRVLARLFAVRGWPGESAVAASLWRLAETLLPERDIGVYTQGLMDLGARICTRARPRCAECPFHADCAAQRLGLVAQLPAPRPRRALPEKCARMLVLRHAGEVLLRKRPARGVWGGLWCTPECTEGDDPRAAAAALGLTVHEARALPSFVHVFTHFRLHILPCLLDVAPPADGKLPESHLWLGLDALDGAALPTPVRRILEQAAGV